MEESPDMSRVKEPKAMVAVMIFGVVFMVGFEFGTRPSLNSPQKPSPTLRRR